ncbi:metabolism of cobalamin associated Db isoform X2 [Dunckerocampus dactyliophorus]|uniref:metabolism of cobalamin associated Db isoform X2 n=1 Tax=Dunckerocampus dactyliophorus TaxID=161453 RepID=UPI002405787B|nr:metabolism of cobalamin associated Db isoform X2 [Dunckerocampus dactyliophorus]
MSTVLYSRTRLAAYLPGLQALVHHIASTKGLSITGSHSSDVRHVATAPSISEPLTLWLDETVVPSGVKHQVSLLPGNVGFDCNLEKVSEHKMRLAKKMVPDLLPASPNSEGCLSRLPMNEFFKEDDPAINQNANRANVAKSSVECVIQPCPDQLKQDLQCLFPEAPSCHVTVVTVTQKTQNDMTAWSTAVEEEREQMLGKFVDGAKDICLILQREGFWADFIEPTSGLAFFGSYTNNTFFETDDRYRLLGFQIEDLGCCRVIRHPLWGTHAFVGTIFTNAPPSSLS